jgi:hypothetical protein
VNTVVHGRQGSSGLIVGSVLCSVGTTGKTKIGGNGMRAGLSHHHRKMRCHGGSNDKSNISVVPAYRHEAFHQLFNSRTAEEIAEYLNNVWIDPAYQLVCTKRISS